MQFRDIIGKEIEKQMRKAVPQKPQNRREKARSKPEEECINFEQLMRVRAYRRGRGGAIRQIRY